MSRRILRASLVASLFSGAACGLTTAGFLDQDGEAPRGPDSSPPLDAGSDLGTGDEHNAADGSSPDADASPPACPGLSGATSVLLDAGFCVDRTEVTNSAYAAFLAASPDAAAQAGQCAANASFVPTAKWPPAVGEENLPVAYTDWCDAFAYCAWAGERLCGKIGGGGLPATSYLDAAQSQWFRACSHNDDGAHAYPYGSSYNLGACNDLRVARSAVGTYPGCAGGYAGLFDMSGNMWEWEDSCAGDSGLGDYCHIRGGSWQDIATPCAYNNGVTRGTQTSYVGFRCCADK